jgi:hypothetical protein
MDGNIIRIDLTDTILRITTESVCESVIRLFRSTTHPIIRITVELGVRTGEAVIPVPVA